MITHHRGPFTLWTLGPIGYQGLLEPIDNPNDALAEAKRLVEGTERQSISIWSVGEQRWIWNVKPESEGYLVPLTEQWAKKFITATKPTRSSGMAGSVSQGRRRRANS